jgi:hypothetical protein
VTGATIDHMISLTILIAALLVAMMTFDGLFATAIDYDRNRQVANKAIDITNTICLSPGSPIDWGQTNDTLLGFGLQDPNAGGYALSPYSVMRLNTASDDNQPVEYPEDSGVFYSNISTSDRHAMLIPIGDCVNYTTAAELLGVNGTYGFSVDVTPTLNVTISPDPEASKLTLNVAVSGSGLPLSGATLKYYLFHVNKTEGGEEDSVPCVTAYSNVTQTELSGSVEIEFPIAVDSVYSFVVYVSLGGVTGVGNYANNAADEDKFVVPLIKDFNEDDGMVDVILAHSWEFLHPSGHATAHYNASFYSLTSDFQLQRLEIANSTGILNSGTAKPYNTTQIPSSETGFLVISYMATGKLGSVIVPWGVGALGVPASFSAGIGSSSGYDFVATELRQVKIDGISYQMKVSTWSLSG